MCTPSHFHHVGDRSTLRQLITFMLSGEEAQKPEYMFSEDIEECDSILRKVLDEYSDDARGDIVAAVVDYLLACEHAYMKQGIQTGFRLAVELLSDSNKQPLPAASWKAKASPHIEADEE